MKKKIYDTSYYERHKEEVLNKAAAYYAANKDMLCERQRRYYHNRMHPDVEYVPHKVLRKKGDVGKTKYIPRKKSYKNMTEQERERKRKVDATMSKVFALAAALKREAGNV